VRLSETVFLAVPEVSQDEPTNMELHSDEIADVNIQLGGKHVFGFQREYYYKPAR
jgi:hypothetical protein